LGLLSAPSAVLQKQKQSTVEKHESMIGNTYQHIPEDVWGLGSEPEPFI
jgi:hypothetical protein